MVAPTHGPRTWPQANSLSPCSLLRLMGIHLAGYGHASQRPHELGLSPLSPTCLDLESTTIIGRIKRL